MSEGGRSAASGRRRRQVGLGLALCLGCAPAQASVVSRLGDIYLYDPLSFDAGILQRGISARAGAGTDQGDLELGLDLPFYKDFSLRTAYVQRFNLDAADGHDVTWRFRMPVIESARFGRVTSAQAVYFGSATLGDAPDVLLANHAFGAAGTWARMGHTAHSIHGALLLEGRDPSKVSVDVPRPLDRVGVEARVAHLIQLWEPSAGPGGKWTVTLSTAELDAVHFGGLVSRGGAGRITAVLAAPAIHFTPSYATYTLGLLPRGTVSWDADGPRLDAGGLLNFSVSYRTDLE